MGKGRAVVCLAVLLALTGCSENYVRVSTADQLIDAIGSGKRIMVVPGEIDVSDATPADDACTDRPEYECECEDLDYDFEGARWDGYSLVISHVDNLTIAGSGELESSIVNEPWGGSVIVLEDCRGVVIDNLSIGHRPRGGGCTSGVLDIWSCRDVSISGCDLYGSGVEGAYVDGSSDIAFVNTVIRDCTDGILGAWDCWDILFDGCSFVRNGYYYGFTIETCDGVTFRDCLVERNTVEDGYALFEFYDSRDVLFEGGLIRDNRCSDLFYGLGSVRLVGTEIDNP